jgi:hypothetical protein
VVGRGELGAQPGNLISLLASLLPACCVVTQDGGDHCYPLRLGISE